ncbi:hypothetical protein J4H86_26180 [Spiractinospora alimapuensis]|uniref:hypothetical protein n=1 Tax=Spiractinospora alimapuensis TaxID=2820884 RepID=UPI001F199143|nr:hypothetical protein [Spiractinospora alimapuensis]QVQ52146.1 hypothetical protein J4H86_26180 [Spiractinospora alimapuensis]
MAEPRWIVLIEEETNKQQQGRKIYDPSLGTTYASEEEARQAAWHLANNHRPQHPMSPKSRTVVHHDDYEYTVIVQGATKSFHFTVRVGVAYVGLPGAPPEQGPGSPHYRTTGPEW